MNKVISLLKDMTAQMEKEAEVDEKIYDKLMCWCQTNRGNTQKNLDNLGALLDALMEKISQWTAQSALLSTQVAQLEKDLAAAKAAIEEATALREKQLDEFREAEKDLMQAIQAIKQAILVLDKHHPGDDAFLQSSNGLMQRVAALVDAYMEKHVLTITPKQKDTMTAVIQISKPGASRLDGFLQGAPNAGSYTPASGQIFGVLTQMLETFEANLDELRKQEDENAKAYRALKAAKLTEIEIINEQLKVKNKELAAVNEKLADALKEKEEIIKAMGADTSFLTELNDKCRDAKAEYERRVKLREEEMKAVSEATGVLSGDAQHDLFTRTFNPSLMQIESKTTSNRRKEVSKVLTAAGKKFHNSALVQLAALAKLDAFHKVKDAIETMITQLKKEKADEVKFRDYCIDAFSSNKLKNQDKERRMEVAVNDVTDLKQQIAEHEYEIQDLAEDVQKTKAEMKDLGDLRAAANKEFQQQVQDQRDTVKVLQDALKVLKGFYGLIQTGGDPLPLPTLKPVIEESKKTVAPSGFTNFKRQDSSSVINLLENIIRDTETMEKDMTKDEANDQATYDRAVKKSVETIQTKEAAINERMSIKAKKTRELQDAEKEKKDMTTEIEQLGFEKTDLHNQCDFTMENFDKRQTARDAEVEALRNALAILSGENQGS